MRRRAAITGFICMGLNNMLKDKFSNGISIKKSGKRLIPYLPELLTLLLCAALLLSDISLKEGYHMDELLSFELANAEFNPWIVPTQPQGRLAKFVENELRGENFEATLSNLTDTVQDILQNRGSSKILSYRADVYEEPVWITRQQFVDYITVDERDAFNYLSVYFNVKDDNHPPLHFMALHTVSSIFRGQLTPLMGCGINLACVLGVMMLLMWLGRMLMTLLGQEKLGRGAGIAAALLYGLSGGALSTTLLIRMYGMLTFFSVALLVIHIRKIYFREEGFHRKNKLLILVTMLGFWTQYFFLFYCLALAAVTAALLWRQRRGRELWRYIRSMLLAAAVGVGVFPFAISDVFSSGRGVEALNNLSSGLAGYGGRLYRFLLILIMRIGLGVSLTFAVVCLYVAVYRIGKLIKCRPDRRRAARAESVRKAVTPAEAVRLWTLLIVPVLVYFLLAARMSPYLVDRYIMPIFPMVTLMLVTADVWSMGRLLRSQAKTRSFGRAGIQIVCVCVVLIAAAQFWQRYEDNYLYVGYGEQEAVSLRYADLPCICVCEGVGYYGNLLEFTHYRETLLVTMEELEQRRESGSIEESGEVVVLLKYGEDEKRLYAVMEEKYGFDRVETLWRTRETGADVVLLFGRS